MSKKLPNARNCSPEEQEAIQSSLRLGSPIKFIFGKYTGWYISDLMKKDANYLMWAHNNTEAFKLTQLGVLTCQPYIEKQAEEFYAQNSNGIHSDGSRYVNHDDLQEDYEEAMERGYPGDERVWMEGGMVISEAAIEEPVKTHSTLSNDDFVRRLDDLIHGSRPNIEGRRLSDVIRELEDECKLGADEPATILFETELSATRKVTLYSDGTAVYRDIVGIDFETKLPIWKTVEFKSPSPAEATLVDLGSAQL